MKTLQTFSAIFAILLFASCNPGNKSPLIPKDTTNENERNNKLFVFVGEKIDVRDTYEKGDFSLSVHAKYKVLLRVYGDYAKDTIEFDAYDHYGIPRFINYKNVLMFVTKDSGKYYQEQYQWFDVYKAKNGRWAGSFAEDDYRDADNGNTTVKPEKIDFVEEVSYPLPKDSNETTERYPEPFYKIAGNKAVAVYGNYIEELFKLKEDGILTRRQLFGDNNRENKPRVVLSPLLNGFDTITGLGIPMPDNGFNAFWVHFIAVLKKNDFQNVKGLIFDKFWVSNKTFTANGFEDCFHTIFSNAVINKFWDSSAVYKGTSELQEMEVSPSVRKEIIAENGVYMYRDVTINIDKQKGLWISLSFIKTKDGYKLYECNSSDWMCCRGFLR